MRPLLLVLLLVAGGCTTKVYNPNKTAAQQQAYIAFCSQEANRKFWMDSIAALYNAYDCLKASGYTREQPALAAELERAFGGTPPKKTGPVRPCTVPCRERS